MKVIIPSVLAVLSVSPCAGQDTAHHKFDARNSVFIEAGGLGGLYSLNYDRIYHDHNRLALAGRIGMSHYFWMDDISPSSGYILSSSALFGETGKRNFAELGFGCTIEQGYSPISILHVLYSAIIGFRHQKSGRGVQYRIVFTPILVNTEIIPEVKSLLFVVWGGASIGYSF